MSKANARILSMNKKAAVQLSVNFIVMTVLALITLGIGFYIVTEIFTTAEEYKATLDEQTQEQIRATLEKGEILSLPITAYTIRRGEKEIIPFGVRNNLGEAAYFYISVSCTEAIDSEENELCAVNEGKTCVDVCDTWIVLSTEVLKTEKETLENRESLAIGLFVKVPDDALSGIFGYSVKVCTGNFCDESDSTQYGTTKKLYITVPE